MYVCILIKYENKREDLYALITHAGFDIGDRDYPISNRETTGKGMEMSYIATNNPRIFVLKFKI